MNKYNIPSIKDLARQLSEEKRGQKAKSMVTATAETQHVRVIAEKGSWRTEVKDKGDIWQKMQAGEAIEAGSELGPATNTEKLARQLVQKLKDEDNAATEEGEEPSNDEQDGLEKGVYPRLARNDESTQEVRAEDAGDDRQYDEDEPELEPLDVVDDRERDEGRAPA